VIAMFISFIRRKNYERGSLWYIYLEYMVPNCKYEHSQYSYPLVYNICNYKYKFHILVCLNANGFKHALLIDSTEQSYNE
jgi:hypothetical protein